MPCPQLDRNEEEEGKREVGIMGEGKNQLLLDLCFVDAHSEVRNRPLWRFDQSLPARDRFMRVGRKSGWSADSFKDSRIFEVEKKEVGYNKYFFV